MPLNKLDNFIKNTEGRILYVSPADLDATDSIDNEGNSLARPFKTIQRALIESARFSYVVGKNNDLTEQTTILLMPGEHEVDNRPGWLIYKDENNNPITSPPDDTGATNAASSALGLSPNSNFDLDQSDNVLCRFNSVNGGVIVPRGTSIVGLDLRKTKIRPKYVPNPTDSTPNTAIFRITGACYLWQFSFFDGKGEVYTKNDDFTDTNKAVPTFSHHKITCFEYADGINEISSYGLTDLDMYYAKLSHAYGTQASDREIPQAEKYPDTNGLEGLAKQRPEFEIVGAFADDPLQIQTIEAGTGGTPTARVTVRTTKPHGLTVGTPIKVSDVAVGTPEAAAAAPFNVSTVVSEIDSTDANVFYYTLSGDFTGVPATPGTGGAKVIVETDSVSGASPYIFNVSLRSVWGMNGMWADGSKATGFRSMVVAQFTGVSLQKDDRSFVKYNPTSRAYDIGANITPLYAGGLSSGSSLPNDEALHLDSEAVYRKGWETTHIRISNNAIVQIVSVFAIGYNKHFLIESGGDASITNSNSNFGQMSLISDGFRNESFDKDNKGFITHIIPPRSIDNTETDIDWLALDVANTVGYGSSDRLYINGFESESEKPGAITQGFRVGAKQNDLLYVDFENVSYSASIVMSDGSSSSKKEYSIGQPTNGVFALSSGTHTLETGEKVIIISDGGDVPENITPHQIYYIINENVGLGNTFKLASSEARAIDGDFIDAYGGSDLRITSRVSDKDSGDKGHPIQWDGTRSSWYINTVDGASNEIYSMIVDNQSSLGEKTDIPYIKRISDDRSLDEKLYKIRVVIPEEVRGAKTPENGAIIQESSSTGLSLYDDESLTSITASDSGYAYNRNIRFISTCSFDNSDTSNPVVIVASERPHNLAAGNKVTIRNVQDDQINVGGIGTFNKGYNGVFEVDSIVDTLTFKYKIPGRTPGNFNNNLGIRSDTLPRFEKTDCSKNFYVYRNEVISEYIEGKQDGIYHIFALNADSQITSEFTDVKYSQNVVDLYPQSDRDNVNDNPLPTKSFALRTPLGEVASNDLKKSLTKESIDKLSKTLLNYPSVSAFNPSTGLVTFDKQHHFGGVYSGTITNANNGFTPGVYRNVKCLNSDNSWNGVTANITVVTGPVGFATINNPGSGYSNTGNIVLKFEGFTGTEFTVTPADRGHGVDSAVQFTGSTIKSDTVRKIVSVGSSTQITVTTGDTLDLDTDQYIVSLGPVVSFTSVGNTITANAHGLVTGNKFTVVDTNDSVVGEYIVTNHVSTNPNEFEVTGGVGVSSGYIIKNAFASNKGSSDVRDERLAERSHALTKGDTLVTSSAMLETGTSVPITVSSQSAVNSRYPLGTYIKIDDEIMRVSTQGLQGSNDDELYVIRGALASKPSTHASGSLVTKIEPLPVEFRRPSIVRASGHTFEYLGYGPGNYSTGLPQVQVRTLTEREEFLAQSQERSGGIVVYTGMNNKGDFFIGNQKKSSATGEEVTFDTPIPTVTGQNASRLSAVFDEVVAKERVLVEGGVSGQILSQFDGPVIFNKPVTFSETPSIGSQLRVVDVEDSVDINTGAAIIKGGLGVAKNVNIGINLDVDGHTDITSIVSTGGTFGNVQIGYTDDQTVDTSSGDLTLNAVAESKVAIQTNTTITGILSVTDDITAFWSSDERLKDNITPIEDPLAKVISISGNTFEWNDKSKKRGTDTGLIAQEVEALELPGLVVTRDNGYLAVDYHKVVPLLVEAIKELSGKVDALEQRLQDK